MLLVLYILKDESDGSSYPKSPHDMQVVVLYRYRVSQSVLCPKFAKKKEFLFSSIYSSIDFGKLNVSCGSYWSFRVFNSGY